MADEENTESTAESKSSLMPMLIAGIAALVIGLGAGFVIFSPGDAPVEASEGGGGEATPAESAEEYKARLLELEPIVANIEGDGYTRLLKMTVVLECEDANVRGEAEGRMAQIRDSTLTLVSSRRLVDLIDFEGKALLKEDLRERVNQVLSSGRVDSVLLTEFVVQ